MLPAGTSLPVMTKAQAMTQVQEGTCKVKQPRRRSRPQLCQSEERKRCKRVPRRTPERSTAHTPEKMLFAYSKLLAQPKMHRKSVGGFAAHAVFPPCGP